MIPYRKDADPKFNIAVDWRSQFTHTHNIDTYKHSPVVYFFFIVNYISCCPYLKKKILKTVLELKDERFQNEITPVGM